MALLILDAAGPRAEALALAAGEARGIPVGWDAEFESATFDGDAIDEDEPAHRRLRTARGDRPGLVLAPALVRIGLGLIAVARSQ